MPAFVPNAARWLSTEIRPLLAFGIDTTVGAIAYKPTFGDPGVAKPAFWFLSLLSGLVFGLAGPARPSSSTVGSGCQAEG